MRVRSLTIGFTTLLAAFSLTACGGNPDTSGTTTAGTSNSAEAAPSTTNPFGVPSIDPPELI